MEYNKAVSNASPWGDQPSFKNFLEDIDEIPKDDGNHPLLADDTPGYSAAVIQKSLMTWMHLGKKEGFGKICKFYHYLEQSEANMTALQKAKRRQQELEQSSQAPPMSEYFLQNWGHIYGINSTTESQTTEAKLDKIWETGQVSQTAKLQLQNLAPNLCSVYWR